MLFATASIRPASGDSSMATRGFVVLGLGKQIHRNPIRIGAAVGNDDDLGRAGDHVDTDHAEHPALGRRDVGIARSHDLVDRRNRRGAVGKRGDRLRAADRERPRHLGDVRRGQHQRAWGAVRDRHDHHDLAHSRDLRRMAFRCTCSKKGTAALWPRASPAVKTSRGTGPSALG